MGLLCTDDWFGKAVGKWSWCQDLEKQSISQTSFYN